MRQVPEGWTRVTPGLFYEDAPAAIDFLCRVFGFETRLKVEAGPGVVVHSELVFGEGLVLVNSLQKLREQRPGVQAGPGSAYLMLYVDDVDAHCARARAAGARITTEPRTSDYGDDYWTDRSYSAEDPEGHTWWFVQRMKG
ncbi:VOC family protein [Myxococcus sp. K15C18031901]|uniref:VOC family protein n=1 Tax=Myxococcus dinghuensis TaxID=2906761 RepID=UPI0020A749AF|nr:VOC family protein [Myxococcus dinghuensis]MCP3100712.1 VOC family protein [Myxococcus dinghuensis]